MVKLPVSIQTMIDEISTLPGIGRKTAQRLGFFLLKRSSYQRSKLAQSIIDSADHHQCVVCHCLSESTECPLCNDTEREAQSICIVEEFLDMYTIDQSPMYKGLYHILGGVLSPIDGISAQDLHLQSLFQRITPEVTEVIIATNTTLEGEATALYIKEKLKAHPHVKVTRIARGLPVGSDLEYADSVTLQSAFEGRRVL
jgi:recombination protein RecR